MKHLNILLGLALISVLPLSAQNRIQFAGNRNAIAYNYGGGQVSPPPLYVGGTTSVPAGTGVTLTVAFGLVVAGDGTQFMPFATNAKINIGVGANQDSVTPSAVSCSTPAVYNTCSITVTTTYAHGINDPISSATVGLQEAVNIGPGTVVLDKAWTLGGGTDAIIAASSALSWASLQDNRGIVSRTWSMQPTTLTSLAVPATLTSATVASATTGTGTWTAAAVYTCVTYVDALGGEGPCSATYNFTATASVPVTFVSPAASTGAVGWRAYAGATYNGAYLLPISATSCTLTTLETVMPACAIGSNATFTAIYATTTTLRPNGQSPTVNLNLPMPQGHTTFAYQPTGSTPVPFQANYGPFPAFGSLTAGQIATLGSVNLPAGYLNYIGRTVRVSGKIALTTLNTATLPSITISLGWVGGTTAGAPVATCSLVPAAAGSTATANEKFTCDLTVNAVGTTAVGSIVPSGSEMLVAAAGGALTGATVDTGTAAIGSLGLFAQDTLNVTFTSTTNVVAGEQLLDLHIETIQ